MINTVENFRGGKTSLNLHNWKKITSDRWILQTICGYKIELDTLPYQHKLPRPIKFDDLEKKRIQEELDRFNELGIIEMVSNKPEQGEYISNIFFRPKKDDKIRVILNLKRFNEHIENFHFKMETLNNALNAMTKNCYMGSVDLSEAYFSIKLREKDLKWFRFWFSGQKYQFKVLVMGLATAPRVWTKILKPVFASLRKRGFISSAYIDDSYLQGQTYQECANNILETVILMDSLGLTVNTKKSVLNPSKQLVFVGFRLCSETMTVRLTSEKVTQIRTTCINVRQKKFVTIRVFAKLIGMLVAAEPGVQYAQFFFKPLEKAKEQNLNWRRGNYDTFMRITPEVRRTLTWWVDNVETSLKNIITPDPEIIMYTDSSSFGWGAVISESSHRTSGLWSLEEQALHINVLELKACKLALLALCSEARHVHIRVMTDNTTTCAYINKFGGRKHGLDEIARTIWEWCFARSIHLSAAHIPGILNIQADKLSRTFNA